MGPLFRKVPPFVIEPDIKELADGIGRKARKHQSGRIGKDRTDRGTCKIAFAGRIQKPGLTDQNEDRRGCDTEINRALCFLFAVVFTEDIRDEKGGSKQDIAEGHLKTEGIDNDQYLNVCGNSCDHGPQIETGSAEDPVAQQHKKVSGGQ